MKGKSIPLGQVAAFCDKYCNREQVADFDGAFNGLQCENRRQAVSHIGVAVDAGLGTFERAAFAGVDFLIVHHGLFWNAPHPFTGVRFRRLDALLSNGIALYGAHLPLDVHQKIGNNATLARLLKLPVDHWTLPYEGTPTSPAIVRCPARADLRKRLGKLFSGKITAIEKGPAQPKKIVVVTGSGASVMPHLGAIGADTLITGELRQAHFAQAEDEGLNLYLCGHYATEVFGVQNLAAAAAKHFDIPCTWIPSDCPL